MNQPLFMVTCQPSVRMKVLHQPVHCTIFCNVDLDPSCEPRAPCFFHIYRVQDNVACMCSSKITAWQCVWQEQTNGKGCLRFALLCVESRCILLHVCTCEVL